MIVGPISPRPRVLAIGGASTRVISSQKIACCVSVALRPPYSFGHETAAQLPSCSFRCQALKYGNDSSMGFSRHSLQSRGALARNHARNSSRNRNSSSERFRSIQRFLSNRGSDSSPYRESDAILLLRPDFEGETPSYPVESCALSVTNSGRMVSWPCQYFLRKSFFRIFPVPVFGKLSRNSTECGHL